LELTKLEIGFLIAFSMRDGEKQRTRKSRMKKRP